MGIKYHEELEIGRNADGEISAKTLKRRFSSYPAGCIGSLLNRDLSRFMGGKDNEDKNGFDSMLEGLVRYDNESHLDLAESPLTVNLDSFARYSCSGEEVVSRITIEQVSLCEGGIASKIVGSLGYGLKLSAKCAVASLIYFGARAVAGGDVLEVFNENAPQTILQGLDMIAYSAPVMFPLLKAYI